MRIFGKKKDKNAALELPGNVRDVDPPIGTRMEDGTIFAGISPETDEPMYVTPKDAPTHMKWERARNYAKNLDANGHTDWRLPKKGELQKLFKNRAAIGHFDQNGYNNSRRYWSSNHNVFSDKTIAQDFSSGIRTRGDRYDRFSVRCVRTEPRP